MNLSCAGDKLPNSGCIFFKALGRISVATGECTDLNTLVALNVFSQSYAARFNCTVPGTVADFTEECNITTTGNAITSTTSALAAATTTVAVPTNAPSRFEYGSTYFVVLFGCGVSVVAFVVAICAVCLIVCLFRKLHHGKTQTAHPGVQKQFELQNHGKLTILYVVK